MTAITYKSAGVNIDAGNEAVSRIKKHVHKTFNTNVLSGLGAFGSLYDLRALLTDYAHPIMVQSIDGVGTKTIIARMAGNFRTIGADLLSATSNDILVMGAKTLTLLDYIASGRLDPHIIEAIVAGMSDACCLHGVALVGGETAEMPDTYLPNEHDLVGIVTGVVDKDAIIDGRHIMPGHIVLGFASSGLHTNGYSLARKVLFETTGFKIDTHTQDLGETVGEALLKTHLNYAPPILAALSQHLPILGMAHITGGGLLENIPRVLPKHCAVEIKKDSFPIPPIFQLIESAGHVPLLDLYRTLNMGIGLVVIGPRELASMLKALIIKAYPDFKLFHIGDVVEGTPSVHIAGVTDV